MMKLIKKNLTKLLCLTLFMLLIFSACSQKVIKETEYSPGSKVTYKSTTVEDNVVSELRRVLDRATIEGNGIFESDNEGLARRTAINLAVAELAGQVQTLVRSESTIYNNKEVRDIVENKVHALVNNYRIDTAGYDSGTKKYRVRLSISGEIIRREIEKYVK